MRCPRAATQTSTSMELSAIASTPWACKLSAKHQLTPNLHLALAFPQRKKTVPFFRCIERSASTHRPSYNIAARHELVVTKLSEERCRNACKKLRTARSRNASSMSDTPRNVQCAALSAWPQRIRSPGGQRRVERTWEHEAVQH